MAYGRIITCILKIKAEDTTETWIVCFQPGVNNSSCEKTKTQIAGRQLRRFNASISGEKRSGLNPLLEAWFISSLWTGSNLRYQFFSCPWVLVLDLAIWMFLTVDKPISQSYCFHINFFQPELLTLTSALHCCGCWCLKTYKKPTKTGHPSSKRILSKPTAHPILRDRPSQLCCNTPARSGPPGETTALNHAVQYKLNQKKQLTNTSSEK